MLIPDPILKMESIVWWLAKLIKIK